MDLILRQVVFFRDLTPGQAGDSVFQKREVLGFNSVLHSEVSERGDVGLLGEFLAGLIYGGGVSPVITCVRGRNPPFVRKLEVAGLKILFRVPAPDVINAVKPSHALDQVSQRIVAVLAPDLAYALQVLIDAINDGEDIRLIPTLKPHPGPRQDVPAEALPDLRNINAHDLRSLAAP